jgi:hypothetical protein
VAGSASAALDAEAEEDAAAEEEVAPAIASSSADLLESVGPHPEARRRERARTRVCIGVWILI